MRVTDVDLDNDEDIIVGNAEGILYKIENVGMGSSAAHRADPDPRPGAGPYDYVFTDLDFDNDEEIVLIDARETVFLLENLRDRFGAPRKIAGPSPARREPWISKSPTMTTTATMIDHPGRDRSGAAAPKQGKGRFSSTPNRLRPRSGRGRQPDTGDVGH